MSHKLGMCAHYNWDANELKPDQDYVNGQRPTCKRPLQGIQGKAECADLHRPLELYGPDKVTPVRQGTGAALFLKSIDLLHSFGDCLDLARPLVVDGKIFMQFHDWMPPTYDESEDPHMVDETPDLSTFAFHDDTRSESGFSRSSRASWKVWSRSNLGSR